MLIMQVYTKLGKKGEIFINKFITRYNYITCSLMKKISNLFDFIY